MKNKTNPHLQSTDAQLLMSMTYAEKERSAKALMEAGVFVNGVYKNPCSMYPSPTVCFPVSYTTKITSQNEKYKIKSLLSVAYNTRPAFKAHIDTLMTDPDFRIDVTYGFHETVRKGKIVTHFTIKTRDSLKTSSPQMHLTLDYCQPIIRIIELVTHL